MFLVETIQRPSYTELIVFSRDKNGKKIVKRIKDFHPYFYVPETDPVPDDYRITGVETGHISIIGEAVKKIFVKKSSDVRALREMFTKHYEADILFNHRYIIDKIGEITPYKLRILYLDIELDSNDVFPDLETPNQAVTCITTLDSFTDELITFLYESPDSKKKVKTTKTVKVFKTEETMLLGFLSYIVGTDPDMFSGWNCLDKNTYIRTDDGLITLDNIEPGQHLQHNNIVKNVHKSIKKVVEFGNRFGIIKTSNDHKFLVTDTKYKYKNLDVLKKTQGEFKRVKDIDGGFLRFKYDDNKNVDIDIPDEILYLLGLIYADGSLTKHRTFIFNNNKRIIKKVESIRRKFCPKNLSSVYKDSRHKNATYRISFYTDDLKKYLSFIANNNNKKELNIELLSHLSTRQFGIFCAGLIDGDGSTSQIQIKLHSSYKERNGFHSLLLMNGVISTRSKIKNEYGNLYHISSIENRDFLSELKKHTINFYKIKDITSSTKKNRKTNMAKYFIDRENKEIYSAITINRELDETCEMVDIETDTHTFMSPFITHNCEKFDLLYLIRRMQILKLPFEKLSPINSVRIYDDPGRDIEVNIKGRIISDMMRNYKHFRQISNQGRAESYSLEFTGQEVLGQGKIELPGSFHTLWVDNPDKLVEYNRRDVTLVRDINTKLGITDFFNQIRCKSCAPFNKVYANTVLIDGLLLRRLNNKLVLPSRPKKRIEADKYSGASVFLPKPGLYKNVMALDVRGMYPNIIRTFNMSYETFNINGEIKIDDEIGFNSKIGIIPATLIDLEKERKYWKKKRKEAKTEQEYKVADYKQYAVKVLMNCFSYDTDILTEQGIKNIQDVKVGEMVYSINPDNKRLELKPVIRTFKYDYSGDMVHFKTQSMDLLVTPNHKILYETPHQLIDFCYAKDYKTQNRIPLHKPMKKRTADFISLVHDDYDKYRYLLFKDKDLRTIKKEFAKLGVDAKLAKINLQKAMIDSDEQTLIYLWSLGYDIRAKPKRDKRTGLFSPFVDIKTYSNFIGWYVSEGSKHEIKEKTINNVHRGKSYNITISQSNIANAQHCEMIKSTINNLKIRFRETTREISFSSDAWFKHLKNFGENSYTRCVPNEIFKIIDKEEFIKTLYFGDGHKKRNLYTTTSKKLMEQVIIALTELGYRTWYSYSKCDKCYRIKFKKQNARPHKDNISIIKNNSNKVYSIEVADNHTVMAGRNNTFNWSGQSAYGYIGSTSSRLYKREVANAITTMGRRLIKATRDLLEDKGFEITYGDSVAKDSEIIIKRDGKVNFVNIEDLFNKVDFVNGEKEYSNLENVETLTIDKNGHSVFKPIKYVMRHKTNKRIVRTSFTNSWYIDTTEDHSLIGYKNTKICKTNNTMDRLTPVRPFNIGKDIKTIISLRKIPTTYVHSKNLPDELYVFMGFFIGDGSFNSKYEAKNYFISLSAGLDETEVIDKILIPLKQLGWIKNYWIKPKGDIMINGLKIVRFIEKHCRTPDGKTIPTFMMNETSKNVGLFLNGLFSSDGTVMVRNNGSIIKFSNNIRSIIKTTRRLLYKLGISNSEFINGTENSYNGKKSGTHTSEVIILDNVRFKNKVGFILDRKNRRLSNATTSKFNKMDFYLKRVTDAKEIVYDDYVYDIEVADTHRFFANGILVHNTDSVYVQSKKTGLLPILKEGNDVVTDINELYKTFSTQYGAKECTLDIEFEKIFKKILFVRKKSDKKDGKGAKKKYAYMLMWADGKASDEKIKFKGFSTVRSDSSRVARKAQKTVINMILHSKKKDEVISYLRGLDKQIRTRAIPDEDFAFPGAITKDLYSYGSTKADDGTIRKTGIPPIIAAARYSNKYLGTRFGRGMKPKWIHIKSTPPGYPTTKYVAFVETIPSGFIPDYDKINEKAFKMKLETIFEAVGWGEFPQINTTTSQLKEWGI